MIIKSYKIFMESINSHKFGCVMIEVPITNWNKITSSIEADDVYNESLDGESHGIQDNPHVTILYGLHDNISEEQVKSVFDEYLGELNVKINGIDIFENKDFDVVKFNVSPDGALQHLHDELSKFPNSNQYPNYKPHITIAYVKSGTGKKYIDPNYKYEFKNLSKVCYSKSNGQKIYFEI